MSLFSYQYTKAGIVLDQLMDIIQAVPGWGSHLSYVNPTDDTYDIFFDVELTAEEQLALSVIVENFVAVKYSTTLVYDAIVGSKYTGDYQSVADAFDAGHTTLYVRDGIYMETRNVVMPNYGSITGESGGNVVISFMGAANGIVADGSGGAKETAGTISVEKNTRNVVGVGTTFTNIPLSEAYILLGINHYKVRAIIDATHLELDDVYVGTSLANIPYRLLNMRTGIKLEKLIIVGSASYAVYMRACRHLVLDSVSCKSNALNYHLVDCGDSAVHRVLSETCAGAGLGLVDCNSMVLNTLNIYNNMGHGVSLSGQLESVLFVGCESSNNGGCGMFNGADSQEVSFVNCVVKSNESHGIHVGSAGSGSIISSTTSNLNGGCGIHVESSRSSIINNISSNNAAAGIYLKCAESCVLGNILCDNTVSGVTVEGSDNIVKSNIVRGSASGVEVVAGSVDSMICYNNLKGNTASLSDSGTGTDSSGNKV